MAWCAHPWTALLARPWHAQQPLTLNLTLVPKPRGGPDPCAEFSLDVQGALTASV